MILLVLPHQLFAKHPGLKRNPDKIVLVEDSFFFGDPAYPMTIHQQKVWLHRATMKRYAAGLQSKGHDVGYIDYNPKKPRLMDQLPTVLSRAEMKGKTLAVIDPTDYMVEKHLRNVCDRYGLELERLPNPGFLNSPEQNRDYRRGKKRWFMADFYKWQRRRLDVLMEGDQPQGDRWSFDEDNRKKVPKKLLGEIPELLKLKRDTFDREAVQYVNERFASHPGSVDSLYYPTTHAAAKRWLQHFLEHRFERFGEYEDAIVEGESWLWHSMLTPALNIGLLTPDQIVKAAVKFARQHDVPINSVEGFIRQVIGWREYMRATYEDLGVTMRTTNRWEHHHVMPQCFYDATTGIDPVDDVIERLLKTGYCHHIERLMVLGGFMFLCGLHPDEIYRWFMEMFVDSYDWVMVPNVYAMSQNADGGAITTKPYFSGSSYVRKMSHYPRGEWCDVWDGLYWRWIWLHREELGSNPRWAMMCRMAEKMDDEKRQTHLHHAEAFLERIHKS